MRKTVSLVLAICGTLLLLLLFATGRLIYTHVYSQDFSDIAETGPQSTITLTENDVEVPQTDDNQKTAIIQLLSEQTYTAYPTANRLTVTFQNGNSIGVNTDGYVFVNGKLRAIKSGDGRNLYHDLFVLFYPTAKE